LTVITHDEKPERTVAVLIALLYITVNSTYVACHGDAYLACRNVTSESTSV